MKRTQKVFATVIALAIVVCSIFALAVPTAAASITGFDILSNSKYAKTYTLATSGRTIPYTNQYLSTRGTVNGCSNTAYIDNAADELYIKDVGCTGGIFWARVSYPISSSKRVEAYIPLSALTKNNGSHAKATSSGKFYCSLREGWGNNSSYYVAKGDTVYLIATGSKYQILYPTSGGLWRLAWCNASDYQKYCGTSTVSTAGKISTAASANTAGVDMATHTGMIDVTSYFAGRTVSLQSVQNGRYVGVVSVAESSTTRSYTGVSAASDCRATTSTTFSFSSLTADGWVGIRSNSIGKYFCTEYNTTNNPIRVTANSIQAWECYRIYLKGSDFYIRAQVNGKYLCVRVDLSGAPVQAIASNASAWERFRIYDLTTGKDMATVIWDSMIGKTVASIKTGDQFTSNYGANNGYSKGQCTWYAHGRFLEVTGIALSSKWNAGEWLWRNKGDSRISVLDGANKITAKAVAVSPGHVMFVEHVTYNSSGTPAYVYLTESNVGSSYNGRYDAGVDCVVKKLSYSEFLSQKNPVGYIIAK